MKNLYIYFFAFNLFTGCKLIQNQKNNYLIVTKNILLKLNSDVIDSDIGEEFSRYLIHSVKGNVKSVQYTNYEFSEIDSIFIPTLKAYIDSYKNSTYNIDRNGQITDRLIFRGAGNRGNTIEKYEIINKLENKFKIDYKLYNYNNEILGKPYTEPRYTDFYDNGKLVKKYHHSKKDTFFYQYNDFGKIAIIDFNLKQINGLRQIRYKYDSEKRIIEKRYYNSNMSIFYYIKYLHRVNGYYKINITCTQEKERVQFHSAASTYIVFNNFKDRIEKTICNLNNYDRLLEIRDENTLIEEILSEFENPSFKGKWVYHNFKYEYEYDDNNNWVSKTIYTDNKPSYKLKRDIKYY